MIYGGMITIAGGGGGGTSLGSGVSGILSLNSETGPHINIISTDSTIDISAAANAIDLSCSGFVSGVQVIINNDLGGRIETSGQILLQEIYNTEISGIQTLNGESGPSIILDSADGSIAIVTSTNNIDFSCSGYVASGFVERIDFDWNGFFTRTDSTIDFDHNTQTFTIASAVSGIPYEYYVEGVKYGSTGDSVVIPSGTEGVNVIYYDDNTLTNVTNPTFGQLDAVIRTKALVSIIYWGTVQQSGLYVGEERHGKSMSPNTHAYLHWIEGLRYIPPGLGLNNITADGDGNLDIAAIFGVDSGAVSDEDIYHAISAVGSGVGLPIYYMTGSTPNWHKYVNPGFSVRTFDGTSSTRLAYNEFTGGVWQLTEVSNRDFVLCHVFSTTEKDNPMISIMGQNVYTNIVTAREGAQVEILSLITNDLLLPETRPIATIIFQTSSTYDNQVKGRIRATDDGDNYIDWRSETISRFAVSTSDHNALSNLQGGTASQYYHLTQIEYDGLTTKYIGHFANMTIGTFTHGLGTNYLNRTVYASGTTVYEIIPDEFIIEDENNVTLLFNTPQTGFMVITG